MTDIKFDEAAMHCRRSVAKFEYQPRVVPYGYEPHQIHYSDGFGEGAEWQFTQDQARLAELESKHKQAMKDWSADAILKTERIVLLEKEIERLQRWGDHWHQLGADHLPIEIWIENRFKEFK